MDTINTNETPPEGGLESGRRLVAHVPVTNLLHLLLGAEVNGPKAFSVFTIEAQMQVAWMHHGLRKLKCARASLHVCSLSRGYRLWADVTACGEVQTQFSFFCI